MNSINSLFFVALILTFPNYFLFNPLEFGMTVLSGLQIFSTLSWVLLVLSPVFLLKGEHLSKRRLALQITLVTLWPFAVLLIRAFLLISVGDPGVGYIVAAPIFLISDFVMPGIIAFMLVSAYRASPQKASVPGKKSSLSFNP